MPEIMLPEGVEIPDGSVPGDTVEFLAQVKLGEGGKAEIVALDGITIPGYEEEKEEAEEEGEMEEEEMMPKPAPARRGFVDAAMGGMA